MGGMHVTPKGQSQYSPEIDGLRALAVAAVIINHFSHDFLPCGHLGVDVFFVISGYVITSSLYNRPSATLGDLLLSFYSRRVKRLVPALVIFVFVTSSTICFFDPFPQRSIYTGLFSLFGLANIYLVYDSFDYFGSHAQLNVFTHTWSLGVEEQFYFLFPFLIWFSGFGRRGRNGSKNLFCLVVIFATISFGTFIYWSESSPDLSFYLMPARLWEIGAGTLVFLLVNSCKYHLRTIPPISLGINPLFPLVLLLLSLLAPVSFSNYMTIVVVLLTSWLIAAIRPKKACYKILSHPTVAYFGRISYSLYLWHWGVLAISRWTIGIHPWTIPLQVGLIVLLADVSHRYVENPLRRAEWSTLRWKAIAYGIGALFVTSTILLGLVKPFARQIYAGERPQMEAVGIESLTEAYSLPGLSSTWAGEACILSDNSQVGKVISTDNCTLGDFHNARRRVLVLGDSFSAAFVPAFDRLVEVDDFAVTITSSWGASPSPGVENNGPWDKANEYYWSQVVPSLVSSLRPGDAVFLVSDLSGYSPAKELSNSARELSNLEESLASFSDHLSSNDIGLAVLQGNPFVREAVCDPVTASKQWFTPFGVPCRFYSKEETLSRRAPLEKSLSVLQTQQKITIIDLMNVFCPGDTCTYEAKNGQMLYRDAFSHPSIEAARLSAPFIRAALTSIAPRPKEEVAVTRK